MTILPMIPIIVALAMSGGGQVAPKPAESARPAKPAPARTVSPRHGIGVKGKATWYDYRPGHAAAGPALRRALGKHWRGSLVYVCANSRCVKARLSDWCACPNGRVIDLDVRSFARLADPSRGVIRVTVKEVKR